jgi:hypothetical protein
MRRFLTETTNGDVADGWRTHLASAVYCTRGEMSMRHAIVTLLVVTSAVTTAAVAQDGDGHGPPRAPIIIQIPVPTPSLPTGSVQKFFQPTSELAAMTR